MDQMIREVNKALASETPRPMSAEMLVRCLAGEMDSHPEMIVEAIQEDEETLALVRRYGRGLATYEEVREAVSAIC
jgi:hypothetical protein